MEFNAEWIEKRLRSKKKSIINKKYLKTHPEIRKKHRMKNYRKYKDKRLKYAKEYRKKNEDKFKNYYLPIKLLKFKLIKNNLEIEVKTRQLRNKLKDGWIIKSIDWSELI